MVDVRRSTPVVDVPTVGIIGQHVDLGAEAPEDLGRRPVGGAVGAVQQDAFAAQIQAGEPDVELAQVVLERAVKAAHVADSLRLSGRILELGLDRVLGVVVQLEPVRAE